MCVVWRYWVVKRGFDPFFIIKGVWAEGCLGLRKGGGLDWIWFWVRIRFRFNKKGPVGFIVTQGPIL